MKEPNHIIEKVFLEVNTSDIETANSIKNNINSFLLNELFPRLELLFDEYNIDETVVRFDSLNINLSVDNLENLEHVKHEIYCELETRFKQHIEHDITSGSINPSSEKHTPNRISLIKDLETSFLFFIENGYLPWYAKEEYIIEFTKEKNWNLCLKDEDFEVRLAKLLKEKSTAVERFILQFQDKIILSFLKKTDASVSRNSAAITKIFKVLKDNLKLSFLRFLINVSLFNDKENWLPALKKIYLTISENEKQLNRFAGFAFVSEFKTVVRKIVLRKGVDDFTAFETELTAGNSVEPVITPELTKENKQQLNILKDKTNENEKELQFVEKETIEIAVQNAGLILLHPFLKKFFIETGIADGEGLLIKEKSDLAIQTLHFLATGNENVLESNLVLEKFLCNIPLKTPVFKQSLLTDEIRDESFTMLKTAIKHWPALKKTSPVGLQQMFINRDGKLIKKERCYKLIVERKAQDVLLEKLHWNISIIKLPWKRDLLFVEW